VTASDGGAGVGTHQHRGFAVQFILSVNRIGDGAAAGS
jgi:hypothetical protein